MAKDTIIVKDRNWRISLSEAVRKAEDIKVGDVLEVDVRNLTKREGEKSNGQKKAGRRHQKDDVQGCN